MTKNICNQTWTRGQLEEAMATRHVAVIQHATWRPRQHATWWPRHHVTWRPCQHATWWPRQLPAWQTPFGSLTDCHAMTKSWAQQWRKHFVMEWNLFYDDGIFVIEWVLIYDDNCHFVTIVNQWRSFHDKHYFVTNSSWKKLHDNFGIFSDERVVSLMSTYLVVDVTTSKSNKHHWLATRTPSTTRCNLSM